MEMKKSITSFFSASKRAVSSDQGSEVSQEEAYTKPNRGGKSESGSESSGNVSQDEDDTGKISPKKRSLQRASFASFASLEEAIQSTSLIPPNIDPDQPLLDTRFEDLIDVIATQSLLVNEQQASIPPFRTKAKEKAKAKASPASLPPPPPAPQSFSLGASSQLSALAPAHTPYRSLEMQSVPQQRLDFAELNDSVMKKSMDRYQEDEYEAASMASTAAESDYSMPAFNSSAMMQVEQGSFLLDAPMAVNSAARKKGAFFAKTSKESSRSSSSSSIISVGSQIKKLFGGGGTSSSTSKPSLQPPSSLKAAKAAAQPSLSSSRAEASITAKAAAQPSLPYSSPASSSERGGGRAPSVISSETQSDLLLKETYGEKEATASRMLEKKEDISMKEELPNQPKAKQRRIQLKSTSSDKLSRRRASPESSERQDIFEVQSLTRRVMSTSEQEQQARDGKVETKGSFPTISEKDVERAIFVPDEARDVSNQKTTITDDDAFVSKEISAPAPLLEKEYDHSDMEKHLQALLVDEPILDAKHVKQEKFHVTKEVECDDDSDDENRSFAEISLSSSYEIDQDYMSSELRPLPDIVPSLTTTAIIENTTSKTDVDLGQLLQEQSRNDFDAMISVDAMDESLLQDPRRYYQQLEVVRGERSVASLVKDIAEHRLVQKHAEKPNVSSVDDHYQELYTMEENDPTLSWDKLFQESFTDNTFLSDASIDRLNTHRSWVIGKLVGTNDTLTIRYKQTVSLPPSLVLYAVNRNPSAEALTNIISHSYAKLARTSFLINGVLSPGITKHDIMRSIWMQLLPYYHQLYRKTYGDEPSNDNLTEQVKDHTVYHDQMLMFISARIGVYVDIQSPDNQITRKTSTSSANTLYSPTKVTLWLKSSQTPQSGGGGGDGITLTASNNVDLVPFHLLVQRFRQGRMIVRGMALQLGETCVPPLVAALDDCCQEYIQLLHSKELKREESDNFVIVNNEGAVRDATMNTITIIVQEPIDKKRHEIGKGPLDDVNPDDDPSDPDSGSEIPDPSAFHSTSAPVDSENGDNGYDFDDFRGMSLPWGNKNLAKARRPLESKPIVDDHNPDDDPSDPDSGRDIPDPILLAHSKPNVGNPLREDHNPDSDPSDPESGGEITDPTKYQVLSKTKIPRDVKDDANPDSDPSDPDSGGEIPDPLVYKLAGEKGKQEMDDFNPDDDPSDPDSGGEIPDPLVYKLASNEGKQEMDDFNPDDDPSSPDSGGEIPDPIHQIAENNDYLVISTVSKDKVVSSVGNKLYLSPDKLAISCKPSLTPPPSEKLSLSYEMSPFGKVYLAQSSNGPTDSKTILALHTVASFDQGDYRLTERRKKELLRLRSLAFSSPHFLQYYGYSDALLKFSQNEQDENRFTGVKKSVVVTDFYPYSLASLAVMQRVHPLLVLRQVAQGVNHIHTHQIVWDSLARKTWLSPENIFLDVEVTKDNSTAWNNAQIKLVPVGSFSRKLHKFSKDGKNKEYRYFRWKKTYDATYDSVVVQKDLKQLGKLMTHWQDVGNNVYLHSDADLFREWSFWADVLSSPSSESNSSSLMGLLSWIEGKMGPSPTAIWQAKIKEMALLNNDDEEFLSSEDILKSHDLQASSSKKKKVSTIDELPNREEGGEDGDVEDNSSTPRPSIVLHESRSRSNSAVTNTVSNLSPGTSLKTSLASAALSQSSTSSNPPPALQRLRHMVGTHVEGLRQLTEEDERRVAHSPLSTGNNSTANVVPQGFLVPVYPFPGTRPIDSISQRNSRANSSISPVGEVASQAVTDDASSSVGNVNVPSNIPLYVTEDSAYRGHTSGRRQAVYHSRFGHRQATVLISSSEVNEFGHQPCTQCFPTTSNQS